jgi:hypothetical protein
MVFRNLRIPRGGCEVVAEIHLRVGPLGRV